jgi:hypothetical protein
MIVAIGAGGGACAASLSFLTSITGGTAGGAGMSAVLTGSLSAFFSAGLSLAGSGITGNGNAGGAVAPESGVTGLAGELDGGCSVPVMIGAGITGGGTSVPAVPPPLAEMDGTIGFGVGSATGVTMIVESGGGGDELDGAEATTVVGVGSLAGAGAAFPPDAASACAVAAASLAGAAGVRKCFTAAQAPATAKKAQPTPMPSFVSRVIV